MARQGLSRREFVTGAGGALAAAALGAGCVPGGENPYGGVYAGRFTYRIGEPISVLAALQTPSEVILELLRHDTPGTQTLLQQPVQVGKRGNSYRPGVRGAGFGRVAQLATGALDPGLYSVRIPKEALQPENQQNTYHNFPSSN